jgi:membrane protease YdiL (CAAX protease family)
MKSACTFQDAPLTNRFSEPVFVFLAYLLAKFSVLSMTDPFPVDRRFLVVAIFSTFSAAVGAVLAGIWVNRGNGGLIIGRVRLTGAQLAMCIGGGILIALAAYPLATLVPPSGPANPLLAKAFLDKGPAILLAWSASLIIGAPIGEEMVFRGAIQGYLSRRIRTPIAIVGAALLFLLIHVPQLDGYWPAMVAIFGLGIVAGTARVRTGSLLGAMVVHAAYNSVTLAFVLFGRC